MEGFHSVEILDAFLAYSVCSFLLLFGDVNLVVNTDFQLFYIQNFQCFVYLAISGDAEETSNCTEAG